MNKYVHQIINTKNKCIEDNSENELKIYCWKYIAEVESNISTAT